MSDSPFEFITELQTNRDIGARTAHKKNEIDTKAKYNSQSFSNNDPRRHLWTMANYDLQTDKELKASQDLQTAQNYFRFHSEASIEDLRYQNSAALVCFDAYQGIGNKYIFSDESGEPLDSAAYDFLASEILTNFQIANPSTRISSLAILLEELLKNTYEHARHEVNGASVKNSIRGIYIRKYSNIHNPFVAAKVADHPELQNVPIPKSDFLEISIFDSGCGLARTWSKQAGYTFSTEEEYEYVQACFRKYASSTSLEHKGKGLTRVLNSIRHWYATLYIRSGRLALYREMVSSQRTTSDVMIDVTTHGRIPSAHPAVQGTIVGVLLDLSNGN